MQRQRLISEVMSSPVRTIPLGESLADVHRIMNGARVRHLPVVAETGILVGLVSQRDLHLVETLAGVNQEEVKVEEAMSREVLTVSPQTPLTRVLVEMLSRQHGSAVVAVEGRVSGIFTRSDALRVLRLMLEEEERSAAGEGHQASH